MKNQTQVAFAQKQEKIVRVLEKMQSFLTHGEELGVEIESHLKEKLTFALKESKEAKLRIALIGGYSEGKTSIAAAWLGREENDMKISNQESSDEVKIYSPDNEVEIVDTPGLFGFKEKQLDSVKIEKYKDITKKYIAKAHLLLYVMNPNNPIKESHKEDLVWLFKDLGLLSRTIFVLSRFDETTDIGEESEYESAFKIAKNNVLKGLQNALALTDDELNSLSIVAVAANPFGKGLEHWLQSEKIEDFKKLSRINTLQEATKDLIVKSVDQAKYCKKCKKALWLMCYINNCLCL